MEESQASAGMLDFRILGAVRVFRDGEEVTVPGGRTRTMLAALLVSPGCAVPLQQLVEAVWQRQTPDHPRNALQTVLSRLRTALGADLIHRDIDGYRIDLGTSRLDLLEFRALTERAYRERDAKARVVLLDEALDLWTSDPLLGVDVEVPPAWPEERRKARAERARALLDSGRHDEAVVELQELTAADPLREDMWCQLIVALKRGGRPSEALAAYDEVRRLLADELGADPSAELQKLYAALLKGDDERFEPAPQPQQYSNLPLDISGFTGRRELEGQLVMALTSGEGVPVVVLCGLPGIGKTALAVRVAHRVRREFPDGQWFVSLRGGRKPADLLGELLAVAGVSDVPIEVEERRDRLRTALDGRRILLVLDNAENADQIDGLLPATAGNAVLITSRDRLASLAIEAGARCLTLEPLDKQESVMLLAQATGSSEAALKELAEVCGHLPLALRIAAANLTALPAQSVAAYADHLRTGQRLQKLTVDDSFAVRTAFDASYSALDGETQEMFRSLGSHPTAEFGVGAAAAACGTDRDTALRLLGRLVNANLLRQRAVGRYVLHDLLAEYAAELADSKEAVRRIGLWYLHSATAAARHMSDATLHAEQLEHALVVDEPANRGAAQSWFEREWQNLMTIVRQESERGDHALCWQTIGALYGYISAHRPWGDHRSLFELGVQAARLVGNEQAIAWTLNDLGNSQWLAGDLEAAMRTYQDDLDLRRGLNDRRGEASACGNLGLILHHLGRYAEAIPWHRRSLELNRAIGRSRGQSVALGNLAASLLLDHQPEQARDAAAAALDAAREGADPYAETIALGNLAEAALALGSHQQAIVHLTACIEVARRHDFPAIVTEALVVLATVQESAGDLPNARQTATEAIGSAHNADALLSRISHLL